MIFTKKVLCTVLGVGLFFCGMTASASARQNIPSGNYLESCTGARMQGTNLVASCQRTDGTSVRALLRNADHCRGNISNQNGELICDEPEQNIPGGNYRQSCQDMYMRGNTLIAQCKRSDGTLTRSELRNAAHCQGNISNQNGLLVCDDNNFNRPGNYSRPEGTYLQSCTDIRVEGNRVTANCQRTDGSWRQTSAPFRSNEPLSNCDGTLVIGSSCDAPTQRPTDNWQNVLQNSVNSILQEVLN